MAARLLTQVKFVQHAQYLLCANRVVDWGIKTCSVLPVLNAFLHDKY